MRTERAPVVVAYVIAVLAGFGCMALGLSGWWVTAGFVVWFGRSWWIGLRRW